MELLTRDRPLFIQSYTCVFHGPASLQRNSTISADRWSFSLEIGRPAGRFQNGGCGGATGNDVSSTGGGLNGWRNQKISPEAPAVMVSHLAKSIEIRTYFLSIFKWQIIIYIYLTMGHGFHSHHQITVEGWDNSKSSRILDRWTPWIVFSGRRHRNPSGVVV